MNWRFEVIKKTLVAFLVVLLSHTAMAQVKPGTWQRLPPDQEYELLKDRYHNLKRASQGRTTNWTPSNDGKLNLLEFASLTEPLIFINGQDGAQAAKAAEIMKKLNGAAKIIVVGKAGPDTTALPKQKLYSDIKGKIAKKMNIHFGPSLVTQDGKQLRIEEIAP